MASQRARGERFTLAELGLDQRPPFNSPAMLAIEAAQGGLARFYDTTNGVVLERSGAADDDARVLWRSARFESVVMMTGDWEVMQGRLDSLEPLMVELRSALSHHVPDPGGSYSHANSRPVNFVAIRETAQLLADAVVLELQRGVPDRAMTNLVTLIRLARQHSELHWLVNQMIRVALTDLAIHSAWQVLQRPGWSEGELALLQSELEQCFLLSEIGRCLEVGRARGLDFFDQLKRKPSGTATTLPGVGRGPLDRLHYRVYRSFFSSQDLQLFLGAYQISIDGLREANAGAAWVPIATRLDEAQAELVRRVKRRFGGVFHFALLSANTLPNFNRAFESAVRVETRRRLAVVAVALERFRLRHGRLPEHLDELTPDYIQALPADPYVARAFHYRPEPQGQYRLWSVGADGQDDGGHPGSEPGSPVRSSRLDEVWPIPGEFME